MDSISPVFAALGVIEFDALNDLSHWLDGPVEPGGAAEPSGWRSGDKTMAAAARPAGREA